MANSWLNSTYEGDDDPMLTNIMTDIETSDEPIFNDLPSEELLTVAQESTTEELIGFSTLSAHNEAVFAPLIKKPPWLKLPNELLAQIAKQLSREDLLNFALTSKRLNKATIPVIYDTVDLSIHNRGRVRYGPFEDSVFHSHYSSSFRCTDVPSMALTKQEKFLEQVVHHPEYTRYVHSLSWTLLLLREPEWEHYDNKYPLLGTDARHDLIDRPIWHIWEVFEKLTNVKSLDLAYLTRDHGHPLASAFPDSLFPRASYVRLSGTMDYALAASILASNPAKLRHLCWVNVQQPQRKHFMLQEAIQRQPYHKQVLRPWNNLTPFHGDINAYFDRPGPMHNLLGSLAGRCRNLKSLELHKTAERGPRHNRTSSELSREYSMQDGDTYKEWAYFLKYQKHTLQRLLWQQGQFDFRLRTLRHPGPRGIFLERRMDDRFTRIVWPVIMYDLDDWPHLKELQIFGVRSWGRRVDVEEEIEEACWEKFGSDLNVWVDPNACVMDHAGMEVHRYD